MASSENSPRQSTHMPHPGYGTSPDISPSVRFVGDIGADIEDDETSELLAMNHSHSFKDGADSTGMHH